MSDAIRKHRDDTWIKKIQKGDILKAPNGVLRVVRRVDRLRDTVGGTTVFFTIRRCSWTKACYTAMNGNVIAKYGYRPTGKRLPLRKMIDKAIESEIGRAGSEREMTCCDVEGIG